MIELSLSANFDDLAHDLTDLEKDQLPFAMANALTKTAKDAQATIIAGLPSKFHLRTGWYNPSNAVGFKVKTALKTDLEAEVYTKAPFMILQEEGGEKLPQGNHLAVPTENIQPDIDKLIPTSKRPKGLQVAGQTFKLKTKSGKELLATYKGRGKNRKLVILYVLEDEINIKPVLDMTDTVQEVIDANLANNFDVALTFALADKWNAVG